MLDYYTSRIFGAIPETGDTVAIEFHPDFIFHLKDKYSHLLKHDREMVGVVSHVQDDNYCYTVNEIIFCLEDVLSLEIVNSSYF